MSDLKPIVRQALLAALHARGHALQRTRGGYAAIPAQVNRSGTVSTQAFTRRAVNWLEQDGLAAFDDPAFPTTVTLNECGLEAARELQRQASHVAKVGAA